MELRKEIENSTAHRPIRDKISGFVLENPSEFKKLLDMALDISDKNHHKACWNLELVLENKIEWIKPHLDSFSTALETIKDESARRSISKICQFISQKEFGKNGAGFATDDQLQKIAAATFDWLIDESKVATKAYSMRALYLLGKRYDWIYPELKAVLEKDFHLYSAAYKSAAKQLLAKL